jgi:hypothetical protein
MTTYTLEPISSERFELRFAGEAAHVHALEMAPSSLEPKLTQGRWLLLVFAVWSAPDRCCIDTAIDVITRLDGDVELGVRPYDDVEELKTWCPALSFGKDDPVAITTEPGETGFDVMIRNDDLRTPIWLVLVNGRFVHYKAGVLSTSEVETLLQAT